MPGVTAEILQETRARWGLDKPLIPDQFIAYMASTRRAISGSRSPAAADVSEVLESRLWPTLLLFGLGEIIAIILGLALGRIRAGNAAASWTTSATASRWCSTRRRTSCSEWAC